MISVEYAKRSNISRFATIARAGVTYLATTSLAVAQTAALPTGGRVSSGSATIQQPTGSTMVVRQTSQNAVIDWNSFSIGQSNSVTFQQPTSSSSVLNRVTGDTTSVIAGKLSGNGRVYLVNPNGIAITPTGAVDIGGGFIASSLDISDQDFNNGALSFRGKGASASVSNAGQIRADANGFVSLLGGSVSNAGTVSTLR